MSGLGELVVLMVWRVACGLECKCKWDGDDGVFDTKTGLTPTCTLVSAHCRRSAVMPCIAEERGGAVCRELPPALQRRSPPRRRLDHGLLLLEHHGLHRGLGFLLRCEQLASAMRLFCLFAPGLELLILRPHQVLPPVFTGGGGCLHGLGGSLRPHDAVQLQRRHREIEGFREGLKVPAQFLQVVRWLQFEQASVQWLQIRRCSS